LAELAGLLLPAEGAATFLTAADFAGGLSAGFGFEGFLRVSLDIRLPFVAFDRSNRAFADTAVALSLLGKSVKLGIWLQGFDVPTNPIVA
jgi:hypothetical protein